MIFRRRRDRGGTAGGSGSEPSGETGASEAGTSPAAEGAAQGASGEGSEVPPETGAQGTPETTADGVEGPTAEAPAGTPETGDEGKQDKGLIAGTRAALAPVKKRHVLVASVGIMGFIFAGTLLFAAASFWWTSQPSFCGRCHVMEPYIAAWERSAHRNVNCESCHLTPGFFGFVGGKIAGLQVVANYIRGDYEDWSFNAAVSNASCLQCHEAILSKNVHDPDAGVIVSHRDILESGGKCMFCHSTVAHGSAIPPGSATHPTMSACLRCHNDQIAPLDCDLCHVGKRPPTATPPPDTDAGG